jgi:hypothetical protein
MSGERAGDKTGQLRPIEEAIDKMQFDVVDLLILSVGRVEDDTDVIPVRAKNSIPNRTARCHNSPINREFYLAKGTEKFILGRYLLSVILLILLNLRPWRVAARPAILENRGAKSHFCDYFIIRAKNVENVEHAILYIFCSLCFFVRSIVS